MARPVVPRLRATQDIEQAIAWYRDEGGAVLASRFVDAVERAFAHIARYPDSASPRHAQDLGIAGLRSQAVKGFPFLVFFIASDTPVDILRVLHGKRDIPLSLQEP